MKRLIEVEAESKVVVRKIEGGSEIEAIKRDKSSLALALAEQRQLNERLNKDLEKLGGESALEQIETLQKEK